MNKEGNKVIALVDKNGKETWFNIEWLKAGLEQITEIDSKVNTFLNLFNSDGLSIHIDFMRHIPHLANFIDYIDKISSNNRVSYIVE